MCHHRFGAGDFLLLALAAVCLAARGCHGQNAVCADPTCGGHGTCQAGTCTCVGGYSDAACGTYDACFGMTCSQHGSCSGGSCVCESGAYTGALCQNYDPCFGVDCGDPAHGTCQNGACQCAAGYTGTLCAPVQCLPALASPTDGTVDVPNGGVFPSTAQFGCNAGFVRLGSESLSCQATGTWSGAAPSCAETCATSPCQNGGQCDDSAGTRLFACTCPSPAAWEGDRCERDIDECNSGSGGCDIFQSAALVACANSPGSYQCGACDVTQFGDTVPDDPSHPMVACCNAPAAGDHHVPCGDSGGRCDMGGSSVPISTGCMGPADASTSQLSLPVQVAMSGDAIDIQVDPYDAHNRVTILPRDGSALQVELGLSQEMSFAVYVSPAGRAVCTSSSSICQAGQCQNGGRCIPGRDGSASCACSPGTSGSTCETVEDGCAGNPCGDAGDCVAGFAGGHCCICPQGVGGLRCEVFNVCDGAALEETCCTGGRCEGSTDVMHFCSPECAALALPFLGACQDGTPQSSLSLDEQRERYTRVAESLHGICGDLDHATSGGFVCQHADPCGSSPCQNGGTCQSSGYGTYACSCDTEFQGPHCEVQASDCRPFSWTSTTSLHHEARLYDTRIAGNYSFSVRLRDAELEQSSALLLQTYPSALNISESQVDLGYNLSETGRVMSFWVVPRDGFANVRNPIVFSSFFAEMGTDIVSTILTIDGTLATHTEIGTVSSVWEPRAEAFLVSFLTKRSGEYSIGVSISNVAFPGSFIVQVVPGPLDATNTLVDIPPASMRAGLITQINITASDQYGNVRLNNDSLTAEVQPTFAQTNLSFEGQRYVVKFMSNKSALYSLIVTLGGGPVPMSPYSIAVLQGPVDMDRSSIVGCTRSDVCEKFGDIRLTMPDTLNSVGVVVRDSFGNLRDDLDTIIVQIHGHGQDSAESAVGWDPLQELFNATITMHSPTAYLYSVDVLVQPRSSTSTELLATIGYHYAFHSNLNASACAVNDCAHALVMAQYEDGWSAEDDCREAGCLYRAAQVETVELVLDEATTAIYTAAALVPALNIQQRCEVGVSSALYWKDESYCRTSGQGTANVVLPQQPDAGNSRFSIQFTIQTPGLYTLKLSLSTGEGTTWSSTAVDIDVQPGLPSPATTALSYESSSAPTATLAGNTISFTLQVTDVNSNARFGLDEVYAELRLASSAEMNDPASEAMQPEAVGRAIGTGRIAEDMSVESGVVRGSADGDGEDGGVYSFNLTIASQGVYALSVKVCPGDMLDMCNSSAVAIPAATPLVFTVCQTDSLIETFSETNGFVQGSRLDECLCDTGYFGGPSHAGGCLPCDQGSYTDAIGSDACLDCLAGTSCDCSSLTSKVDCGAGTEAACSQCVPCRVSQYQDLEGHGQCKDCSTGFQCNVESMTFPIADKGYWISSDGKLTIHDCAIQGSMPDACPGGDLSLFDSHQYCFLSQHDELPAECKTVVGATCEDGYWGAGCAQCCKFGNQECAYLEGKIHLDGSPYTSKWYKVETEGRCYECPEQDVLQMVVFGVVIALFLAEKLLKFAEVAKLSGSLVGPMVSLINFFQMCDLFKTISLPWPVSLKWFVENVLSIFNFNIHMFHVHPECQLSLTYTDKWMLKMAAPLLLVGLLYVQYSLRYCVYLLASGNARLQIARMCGPTRHRKIGVAEVDVSEDAEQTANPVDAGMMRAPTLDTASAKTLGALLLGGLGGPDVDSTDTANTKQHDVFFDNEAVELEETERSDGHDGHTEVDGMRLLARQDDDDDHGHDSDAKANYMCVGSQCGKCLTRYGLVEDHRDAKHSVCSVSYMMITTLASLLMWVLNGEDLGLYNPNATAVDLAQQVKTTSLLSFSQGFAEAVGCAMCMGVLRVLYFCWRFKRRRAKAMQAERVASFKRVIQIEANNNRPAQVPCRSFEDFGLSFGYRLQHKQVGKKKLPCLAIYVKTKSLDARDNNGMFQLNVGQRVRQIVDGKCECASPDVCTCQPARLYTDRSLDRPLDQWSQIKEVSESHYTGGEVDETLATVMNVLQQEAEGIVRIKRPFTLRLATNQRANASMNFLFGALNPSRMIFQVVVTATMFCLTMGSAVKGDHTAMWSLVGCGFVTFVCAFDWFIFESQTGTLGAVIRCRQANGGNEPDQMADDGDDENAYLAQTLSRTFSFADVRPSSKKHRLKRWIVSKIGTATSTSLFIMGSSFWWQTPFATTALQGNLQSWAFPALVVNSTSNATVIIHNEEDLDAGDTLKYMGMAMMVLFGLRKCSGKTLRKLWDDMASFNSKEKLDEVQFVSMEFLLIGYVMLVSAATQPMACHEDLDAVVKMSADNSIACDFCSEKPNANLAMHGPFGQVAHTYGWLWKCALFMTLLYSIGVPLFFFFTIWKYAGSDKLHTKYYLQHFGFLTSKFRDRWYFWEIGILVRKMLHASISSHAAHRPVRQALLNLIIVFISISAHCYCVPFVNNDANVVEFLTLANTFFMLLIGLGAQDDDTDKGLSDSDAHEIVQQLYWLMLALVCGIFTLWTIGTIVIRLNALMYDLNSGYDVEENQYLEEDMREILHRSKVESAILWATKTRKQSRCDDPELKKEATRALDRVQLLFVDIKKYRNRVSWNEKAQGKRRGNIDRWERRRFDRYFRDIDRSTVYMYLTHAAKLDQEDHENRSSLQGSAFAQEPEGLDGCRLDTLEGFLQGLHASRIERTTWPNATKVLKAASTLSVGDAWKASDEIWHPLNPTVQSSSSSDDSSRFKNWWNGSEQRKSLLDFEEEFDDVPTLLVNRDQLAGNQVDGRGRSMLKTKGKPDKPIRGCNTWKGQLCWGIATLCVVILLGILINMYLAPMRCNVWDDDEEACLQAQATGQRCHWTKPARVNQTRVNDGWCDGDGLLAEFDRCAAPSVVVEQSCFRSKSFPLRHVVIDARTGSDANDRAEAKCSRGYIHMKGSTTFTCLNGHWIGDLVCGSCDPLSNCRSGNTQCSSATRTCATASGVPVNPCEQGFECRGAGCSECVATSCGPFTTAPQHSAVVCNDSTVGSTCTVECTGPGYISAGGVQLVVCQDDGTWDDSSVSCSGRPCPTDRVPLEHSTTRCSDHTYGGAACEFECDDGYQPEGSRTCTLVNGALAMSGGLCAEIIVPFDSCPDERRELLQDAITQARQLVARWDPADSWTALTEDEQCHDVSALAVAENGRWAWRLALLDSEQGTLQRHNDDGPCVEAISIDGTLPPLLPSPPPPPPPPAPPVIPYHCRDNATRQMFSVALRDSDRLVAQWARPADRGGLSQRCAASEMAEETYWWLQYDPVGSGCIIELPEGSG